MYEVEGRKSYAKHAECNTEQSSVWHWVSCIAPPRSDEVEAHDTRAVVCSLKTTRCTETINSETIDTYPLRLRIASQDSSRVIQGLELQKWIVVEESYLKTGRRE